MPQDFFTPGLPTQYERPGASVSGRQKLGVTTERPSMAAMYGDEPSYDELMAAAHGTLESTQPHQTQVDLAANVERGGDRDAARNQRRTERAASVPGAISDAATWPLVAGSFVPGPVGVAAQGGLALQGLYQASDPENSLMERGAGVLAALPFAGHVAGKAMGKIAESGLPSRVWGALDSSEVGGSQYASKGSQIPPVQHYWDALDLGETPAKAMKIGAGKDKASMQALQALQDGGRQARSAPWEDLTSQVDDLADPLAGARSRVAERFGKTYRSETGNPGGSARSVPTPEPSSMAPGSPEWLQKYKGAGDEPVVTPQGIFDSSGRWLAPLAGGADDIAFAAMRKSRDPRR